MTANLLILGGTSEAATLAKAVAEAGLRATVSLAGRVERPKPLPLPVRTGGFGGAQGLAAYLRAHAITHVVDATHPFAETMSRNAADACDATGTPLLALARKPWEPGPGDEWRSVPDIPAAAAALRGPAMNVFLAIGRMHLGDFTGQPQHSYTLRLVDPPAGPPPFPRCEVILDRGPFTEAGDRALLAARRIGLVVSKNSGGTGAYAKIAAARALGVPVLMIDRPALPARREVFAVAGVMDWLRHPGAERGV